MLHKQLNRLLTNTAPLVLLVMCAGTKKGGRAPGLTHSQTWSGEQMQAMMQQSPTPTTPTPTVRTKLQLVDLAGSECVGEYCVSICHVHVEMSRFTSFASDCHLNDLNLYVNLFDYKIGRMD